MGSNIFAVVILFSNSLNFVLQWFFLSKLLTLGILFSAAVRAVVIAKLVILGISFLTSFILALRVVLVAKLVISDIKSSIFLILAFYLFYQHYFLLHHLVYLSQQERY